MPWHIESRDGRFCVVKDASGETVPGGCHDRRADAVKHQAALYANEPDAMTASAAPLKPPPEWFNLPEADGPMPLTVTADGQVYGHLAPWEGCHAGLVNGRQTCVRPPRSMTDYRMFHLGELELADGSLLPVGKVVVGESGHAPITASLAEATRHYDKTAKVGAFVRARDGKHGIWLAGALRSNVAPDVLRDLRANLPSGDWRNLGGNLELIGALSVPVPGYGIPAMVAAADSGEIETLIMAGFDSEEETVEDRDDKGYVRQKRMISRSLTAAALTTKRRDELPRSAFAIPEDRRYPIHDEAHARNALVRSAGKPEAARVRRAVCRRYPDMGECASK